MVTINVHVTINVPSLATGDNRTSPPPVTKIFFTLYKPEQNFPPTYHLNIRQYFVQI
jgi:hypothetical protein